MNGQKADLINLASTLKDDPVALETMKAGTINYLKNQAVGQTGNFSQANYNKSIQALGPKIEVLFGLEEAAQLRSVGNVARFTQVQPRGSYVNNSNTDVTNLARGAGNMAGMAVNAATHSPVGSIVTDALQSAFEKRVASTKLNSMLSPGAGISSQSPTSQFLQSRLPVLSGTAASIPLASILSNFVTNKSDSQLGKRK